MNPAQATRALELLLLCRRFDERAVAAVADGKLEGTVLHSAIGQEAVAVGVALHRAPDDVLLSTHRGVHHCIAWGVDLAALLAECFGRVGGTAGGLAGHMHVVDPASGVLGTNGIVGAGLPLAVGAAAGLELQGSPGVGVAFFGDGAANTGAVAEAMNLAAVWRAPLVLVCEANGFAETTDTSITTGGSVAARAAGYGIPGEVVDGGDVEAVFEAAGAAFARARVGQGPTLLECRTYRAGGHWVGDPQLYRDAADAARLPEHDPIPRLLRRHAVDRELEVRQRVERRLNEVFADVLARPRPDSLDLPAARA